MRSSIIAVVPFLPALALSACFDLSSDSHDTSDSRDTSDAHDTSDSDDAEPDVPTGPVSLYLRWQSGVSDPLIDAFVLAPPAIDPFAGRLSVCAYRDSRGVAITSAHLNGTVVSFTVDAHSACIGIALDRDALPVDAVLDVIADGVTVHGVIPTPPPTATHAFDALARGQVLWIATASAGLIGVDADGAFIAYDGVLATEPFDPEAPRPQSNLVLALAPAGDRAMWVGTAVTGVSWFDPGPDPLRAEDDQWRHGQPQATSKYGAEFAQTPLAIAADPFAPDVAWVATLNGVYRAEKTSDAVVFERVLDGVATAIEIDAVGRVWCGFSTTTHLSVSADEGDSKVALPWAEDALVVFDPGADRVLSPNEERITALPNEGAVTALAADARGVWIGTPYELLHGTTDDDHVALATMLDTSALDDLAVVDLLASPSGVWVATRSECESNRGRLLELRVDEAAANLSANAVTSVSDLSEHGFGERDFAKIGLQPSGRLWVSTFVGEIPNSFLAKDTTATARGCDQPKASERSADLYLLDETGTAQPIRPKP
ncbi:MAG: hypothetical protein JNJ59_03775 [Deltaproteobacteria bacterium]|nr:hypothetical protein [Deltaproteobacteria bacterium]